MTSLNLGYAEDFTERTAGGHRQIDYLTNRATQTVASKADVV
jgi:hypothetical protein